MLSPVLGRPVEILLVEDSPSDAAMTVANLREARIANNISTVGNGEAAVDFLRAREPFSGVPRPDVILLDLNLPRMDGREVLAFVKGDPALASIPVVVLTASNAQADIDQAYRLHANAYVRKPVGAAEFLTALRAIEDFWLAVVQLSTGDG